jgi:Flp pilus assembly protein CpaB
LRRTSRLVLLLGIFLAAVTFLVIVFVFPNQTGGPNGPGTSLPPTSLDTVVAYVDIPLGAVVTKDMVTKSNLSVSARNAGAFLDPSQVIGKATVRKVTAGSQLSADDFPGGVNPTSVAVPKGLRAFAIQVNELTGVGNLVNIGDRLDVVISLGASAFPTVQVLPDGTITVVAGLNPLSVKLPLLLENVQVLGTLAQTAPAPAQAASANGAPAASGPPPQTLTGTNKLLILGVTPAQAEVLLFARTSGTLDVVLRSKEDGNTTVTTDGVILKTLIDKYGVLPPQVVKAILPK